MNQELYGLLDIHYTIQWTMSIGFLSFQYAIGRILLCCCWAYIIYYCLVIYFNRHNRTQIHVHRSLNIDVRNIVIILQNTSCFRTWHKSQTSSIYIFDISLTIQLIYIRKNFYSIVFRNKLLSYTICMCNNNINVNQCYET